MARKKKTLRPRWYRRGELIYNRLIRKTDPLSIGDLADHERLALIFGQARGVKELLAYAQGDLLNLVGKDVREIEAIPGVGPALAAKVAALLYEYGLFWQRMRALQDGDQ